MSVGERKVETVKSTFKIPDDVIPPPLIADQHFVLINIAHERTSPASDKPAIRLLGLFQTEAEARSMVPEKTSISYFVCPTHKFIPLISGVDVSPEDTVDAIVKLHADLIESNERDFVDMVEKQRMGVAGKSVKSIRARSERTRAPRVLQRPDDAKACPPLTAGSCLAGQNFAVITMLHDIRPSSLSGESPLEPLIAVLFATNLVEDAQNYAKYTASQAYPNNDLLVVNMYQWLHLEHVDFEQIVNEYGNDTLNAIQKKTRKNKNKIKEVEKYPECIIEVGGEPKPQPAEATSGSNAPEIKEEVKDEVKEKPGAKLIDEEIRPDIRHVFEADNRPIRRPPQPDECVKLVEDIQQIFGKEP